ncbi:lipopolysaccharide assembly protein LapB [Chryseobacterium sp. MDT2-18]|uniref:type IX secretion system periplasmic lipoprotein PorW/SprE n=1 Tax=Chryseobacterium sp. MDT2-18 TaxID=1259136 RepID=UPI00278AE602|nr:tetratricopeptide repeat protein [Chryseobacterium sp. MDT2-18]MDQ0475917.1 tetratricopeptide (TPR) repeat protein [Chryseobacterium sp. MDT2-18]
MKKTILFLLTVTVFNSCSTRKKTNDSVFMKGFFSYYNTLFNSKDALETELKNRDKAHKDNFYAPYIQLLTYDEQPLGTNFQSNSGGMFGNDPMSSELSAVSRNRNSVGPPSPPGGSSSLGSPGSYAMNGHNSGARKGASILEISEAKALKAIANYSVMKGGEEKNKKMFDAYMLLAQSRLYRNKPLEALDGLNFVFANMRKDKRIPLARIYQAQAYSKMEDYHRAEEVFADLKKSKIKKEYRKLLEIYYSEMLLQSGKKQDAVNELDDAFAVNKNRKLRSRIAFLRGQILSELGRNEEARESFALAYKNANDFEFEVKSQIETAKTFNGKDDDYQGARSYLEKISKKGTYASRKNEFYYALGLMAKKAGKKEEAKEFFTQSLKEKVSDPQIRGLTYYEIGKAYFEDSDYLSAGAFFDSSLAVMTYQPAKILLEEQSGNIKKVSANYYLIKRNDSILALTKMPDEERIAYFNKYIEGIKTKEAHEELERKKEERGKGFDTGDYSATSLFAGKTGGFEDFGSNKGGFYFANLGTVAKGESSFKQIWGNRSLNDNWRTSARSASIEDLKNEAMGITAAPDPRRLEPGFYIEKIPTKTADILALKKARDTASLGIGRMYETYFSDTPLATKTLYDLVDTRPEEDLKLQALYQIFAFNYEKNPPAAERAKQMILDEYPYTSYAEFVRNPKNNSFSQSAEEVEKLYAQAFDLYDKEKYNESRTLIDAALEKYPKDALVPKFSLLNAFNSGKTAGKEIMILQLEQIALNYAKTSEGEKAKEMLKYLKSDLEVEATDDSGNVINPKQPAAPVESQKGIPAIESDDPPSVPSFNGRNAKPRSKNSPETNAVQATAVEKLQLK